MSNPFPGVPTFQPPAGNLSDLNLTPIITLNSYTIANVQVEGFHAWPTAPEEYAYQRTEHRHLFHVTVGVEVLHDDHEIPEPYLLEVVKGRFRGGRLGTLTTHQLAKELLTDLRHEFGAGRKYQVDILEDGEVGASVSYQPL